MFYIDVDLKNVDNIGGDYMGFRCSTCKESMDAAFKGMDGSVPVLRFRCKRCKMDREFKVEAHMFWGLGTKDGHDLPD